MSASVNEIHPSTEATFFILASLQRGPKHGYAIMQNVLEMSGGRVKLSPSTLYENLQRLLRQHLISRTKDASDGEERRKTYEITEKGTEFFVAEYRRLISMEEVAGKVLTSTYELAERESREIAVFIADSSASFRADLRVALLTQPNILVCGEVDPKQNPRELLELIEVVRPAIVLLDIDLPTLSGLSLALEIRQRTPSVAVIMLTPYEDEEQIFQAVKIGASALVSKTTSVEALAQFIRQVYRGENLLNDKILAKPRVAERVLRQFQEISLTGKCVDNLTTPLSHREVEILKYVAEGYGNKTIALVLGISEQVVKNHITLILRKLAAHDRTHAVTLALRHGLLSNF